MSRGLSCSSRGEAWAWRFVHVSTDQVYGDAIDGQRFAQNEKELGDHQATSAYAKSKSRADDVALMRRIGIRLQ